MNTNLRRMGVCVAVMLAAGGVWAESVPDLVAYQGRVANTGLLNGAASVVLSVYTNAAGGTPVYACSSQVAVVDGYYTAWLGTNTIAGGSLAAALSGGEAWIEPRINGVITARERLGAAAYAHNRAWAGVNSMTASRPMDSLAITPSNGIVVTERQDLKTLFLALASQDLVTSNLIWVAGNGVSNGPGSIDRPYDTPQRGYDAAIARFGGAEAGVAIIVGTVVTDLVMNAASGNIHVVGVGRPALWNLTTSAMAPPGVWQRIRGLVIAGTNATFRGRRFKVDNCRFEQGATVYGTNIEFQNCRLESTVSDALRLASGAKRVSVNNSSMEVLNGGIYGFRISSGVSNVEVVASEVINEGGVAIMSSEIAPITPAHLFYGNYIKGVEFIDMPGAVLAFQDGGNSNVAFYHNLVYGAVGKRNNVQYYSHNSIIAGVINAGSAAWAGWKQAGAGFGADNANDTEHQTTYPAILPDAWDD